jgi:mRNA-degrading endonuclease RelE of RelBE toxin-antitoxin system
MDHKIDILNKLEKELKELTARTQVLSKIVARNTVKNENEDLLKAQLHMMRGYQALLKLRIGNLC